MTSPREMTNDQTGLLDLGDLYLKMKFLKNTREKSGQFVDLYRVDNRYCLFDTVDRNEGKNQNKK